MKFLKDFCKNLLTVFTPCARLSQIITLFHIMSKVTDSFIQTLLSKGNTEDQASTILSKIISDTILDIYLGKYPNETEREKIEAKLEKIKSEGASKKDLYNQMGILPKDLNKKLNKNINFYIKSVQ